MIEKQVDAAQIKDKNSYRYRFLFTYTLSAIVDMIYSPAEWSC